MRLNRKKVVCIVVLASQSFAATAQTALLASAACMASFADSRETPAAVSEVAAHPALAVLTDAAGPSCHAPAAAPAVAAAHHCPHCTGPTGRLQRSDCACGHDDSSSRGDSGALTFRPIGCAPGDETPVAKFMRTPVLPPDARRVAALDVLRDMPTFRATIFPHFSLSPEAPPPKG